MKQKIISWSIIVTLILGYLGISRFFSADAVINYGIHDGIIEYSETGTDITDSVIGNDNYIVSQNDNLVLSLDADASPVILDVKTGRKWLGVSKEKQTNGKYGSALVVHYMNINQSENILYSYENCVQKNQVKVYKGENSVDVEYLFGNIVVDYVYPELISKERMEKFLSKMTEDDAAYIKSRYTYFELDMFDGENRTYMLNEYPRLEKEDLYIATDIQSKKKITRTNSIFESVGYTKKDQIKDNGGSETEIVKSETMRIVVTYQLTDTGFKAFVDEKKCKFYSDYPISKIQILPYFDALASLDKGYAVLPSGSGALLDLNDKKTASVEIPIYGQNVTLSKEIQDYSGLASLPVFGQYKNNSGYLCVISDGEQQATVVANKDEFCSAVSAKFTFIDNEKFAIAAQNPVSLFANGVSGECFGCEYILFSTLEENTAYSKMANVYRERLESQRVLKSKASDAPIFLAEVVNSINYKTTALGFLPIQKDFGLTTFEQTQQISETIAKYTGTENLQVMLTGWNKNGVNQQALGKIEFSKSVGNAKEYDALTKYFSNNKISSYLNLNFEIVKPNKRDDFSVSSDAARTLNNNIIKLELKDKLTYLEKPTLYRLSSPKNFSNTWAGYSKSKYLDGQNGIGISEMSAYLYGDYVDSTCFTRGLAIKEIQKILADMKKKNLSVVGDVGNFYTLEYMDLLNNLSATSNDLNYYSCDIPFVQMVLHGHIDYTTQPLNTTDSLSTTLLKLIETGSGLHYYITANEFEDITHSEASQLYASNFDNIKDKLENNYKYVNDALKGLGKENIIEHTYIADDVVCVTYSNGVKIYVNYSLKDFSINGQTIKSKDYLRIS